MAAAGNGRRACSLNLLSGKLARLIVLGAKMTAVIGLGILVITLLLFWRVLPRNGKVHFLVGTQWEPYFAILFLLGGGFGLGLMVKWAVETLV